jgi:protein TonB
MMGFVTQSILLTAAVVVPLIFPDSIPKVQNFVGIFTPTAPLPPPPPPAGNAQQLRNTVRKPFQLTETGLTAPTVIPPKAVMIDEPPLTAADTGSGSGVIGGIVGGSKDGIIGGIVSSVPTPAPPPRVQTPAAKSEPVVAAKPVGPPAPVRVGGEVQEAKLIHKVIPPYPTLAKQARVSGKVELTGFIAPNGRIRQLQVLSGHPLLIPAALDAVRQWVYRPTLLNGEAVEVISPITVHFILN